MKVGALNISRRPGWDLVGRAFGCLALVRDGLCVGGGDGRCGEGCDDLRPWRVLGFRGLTDKRPCVDLFLFSFILFVNRQAREEPFLFVMDGERGLRLEACQEW